MTRGGSRQTGNRATLAGLHGLGWVATVVAALLVIAVGWWVYRAVTLSLRERNEAALLALVDAEAEFLRCMSSGRPGGVPAVSIISASDHVPAGRTGESGEVLVFDRQARLLLPGRFTHELADLGLPVQTGFLDLRDPGVDLTTGKRPALARSSLPRTKMAGLATEGRDGVDLDGYRSYRGVPVAGAWRWLSDLGVGVAAEIAIDEAEAPARVLLRAYAVLIGLVLVAAGAGVVAQRRNAALLRKIREAESEARTLGQYTLVRQIGEGGMGEVYLARHAMLRRPTAIKLLRPDRTSEQTIVRFEREVQQTSRLQHPNTVQIYDFGRTPGGTFYFAMECLVGVGLDKFVGEVGPLPEGRVIYILKQVCASLNEAHGLGLVHRDIKPENIYLCRTGGAFDVVKVLDFGLVMDRGSNDAIKVSGAGAILGTPQYMAPEAFLRPGSVDARSDIYALGAVGYFLLTGKPPFSGQTVVELFNQQTKEKPRPPSEVTEKPILPDLEHAILACLEKDPERRPKSANAFARELEWCRSLGEWNLDKARYWWREHGAELDAKYGLASKEWSRSGEELETMSIDPKGRGNA